MKKSLTVILAVLLALFVFVSCEQSVGDLIGFNLVFKANGGTGTMETVFIKGSSIPAPANEFERSGYTFSSWNTMADGSGTEYEVGDTINGHDVQSVTLFAQWTASLYNITIADSEHGSAVAKCNKTSTVSNGDSFIPLVATPHTGYKLANYDVAGEGASIVDNEYLKIAAGTSGAITVTPVFVKNVYTITVNNTDRGTATASKESYSISDDPTVVYLNAIPDTGFTLYNWEVSAPAGVTIADGTITIPAGKIGDISVTPVFLPNSDVYLVTLEKNGGTVTPSADVTLYVKGVGATLPTSDSISKTGYTFGGWYTNSTCTEGSTTEISSSATGDKTFYAKWTANSYTVTFDGNGSTSGSMSNQNFTYDTAQNLTGNAYSKTGYTFSGWNTAADGSGTTYTDGQSVSNLSSTNGATITLYAQWTTVYTVAFDGNGSTSGSMSNQNFTYDTAQNLTGNAYSKTGYTFNGWNTVATPTESEPGTDYANEQSVSNLTTTPGATVTLYAQWKANSYTVTFDGNESSSGLMSSQIFTYGVTQALTTNKFSKTGYTFTGWNTASDGSGTEYADGYSESKITSVDNAFVTLYARWTANSYTVTFDGNGSTSGSMSNQNFTYGTDQNLTGNAYSKTGYTFSGWNTVADGSGTTFTDEQSVTNLATSGNITLYAQWTVNSYGVILNKDGGTIAEGYNVESYTYGQGATLPTSDYISNTGYTFGGWYDNSGLSGDPVTAISTTETGAKEFWAKWTANTYTVTFNKNADAATGTMADESFTYDTAKNLSTNLFVNNGYTFTGWNTRADGNGIHYDDGLSVTNLATSGNITLYAEWQLTHYTVSIESGTDGYTISNLSANSYTYSNTDLVITFTISGSGTPVVDHYSQTIPATATVVPDWANRTITIKKGSYGGNISITCYF